MSLSNLTARLSNRKMGRPNSIDMNVAKDARMTSNHKIYWTRKGHKTADQNNSIVTCFTQPCLRRFMDFEGYLVSVKGTLAVQARYAYYPPNCIQPNPSAIWILYRDNEPFCTFTNCVEAWLVLLGLRAFKEEFSSYILYVDRSQ